MLNTCIIIARSGDVIWKHTRLCATMATALRCCRWQAGFILGICHTMHACRSALPARHTMHACASVLSARVTGTVAPCTSPDESDAACAHGHACVQQMMQLACLRQCSLCVHGCRFGPGAFLASKCSKLRMCATSKAACMRSWQELRAALALAR
jgi:hypothetical protein